MARFPDSRIVAASRLPGRLVPSDVVGLPLAAYSGGTVWAFHPTSLKPPGRASSCCRTIPDCNGRDFSTTIACSRRSQPGRVLTRTRMSKSSTVTVREKPVEEVASARAGGLTIHGETFVVTTDQRIELVDLTNRVMEFVRRFNIREGIVS